MLQDQKSLIRDWGQKGLNKALVVCLIIVLSSSSFASSNCNAGKEITCKCADGKIEKYRSQVEFLEARSDPNSCCYYKPKPKTVIYTYDPVPPKGKIDILQVGEAEPKKEEKEKINKPSYYSKEIEQPEFVKLETIEDKQVKVLSAFVSRILLPIQIHISNRLIFSHSDLD